MKIVNLTPHAVLVLREDQAGPHTGFRGTPPNTTEIKYSVVEEFPPTGKVARAAQDDESMGEIEINGVSIPLVTTAFGEPYLATKGPEGEVRHPFPEHEDGVYYIVSVLTAQSAKAAGRETSDLLITAGTVRNADGRIVGSREFAVL